MAEEQLLFTTMIIIAVATLPLIFLGIKFLQGKWGKLINGYNFTAKGEKAQFYERKFLKITGWMIIFMGIFMSGAFVFYGFNLYIIGSIFMGISFIDIIVGLIVLNSKKVKRYVELAKKLTENPYYIVDDKDIDRYDDEIK